MKPLLLLIGPGVGLALVLGVEPLAVLRYAGAAASFELARGLAACPRCAGPRGLASTVHHAITTV